MTIDIPAELGASSALQYRMGIVRNGKSLCVVSLAISRSDATQSDPVKGEPSRRSGASDWARTRFINRGLPSQKLGLASDALRTPRTLSCLLLGKALGETARASVAARADVTGLRRHCAERHTLSRHRQRRCQRRWQRRSYRRLQRRWQRRRHCRWQRHRYRRLQRRWELRCHLRSQRGRCCCRSRHWHGLTLTLERFLRRIKRQQCVGRVRRKARVAGSLAKLDG